MSGDSRHFVARVTVADARSFARVALAFTASQAAAATYSPTRQSMLALLESIRGSSFRSV